MGNGYSREPMLDLFIFETMQLIEQLEQSILSSEKSSGFEESINEIFRIMHTIKGSSAMMMFNSISSLAHALEDLFYYIREEKPQNLDYSKLSDIVLEGIDFIKGEVERMGDEKFTENDSTELIANIKACLSELKKSNSTGSKESAADSEVTEDASGQKYYIASDSNTSVNFESGDKKKYQAVIFFEDGCEMEHIRAFTVVHHLKEFSKVLSHFPEDVINGEDSIEVIRQEGFKVIFATSLVFDEVQDALSHTIFLRDLELIELEENQTAKPLSVKKNEIDLGPLPVQPSPVKKEGIHKETPASAGKQGMISVNIAKLDKLMDLVGELVIAEAMVTRNPELNKLQLDSFHKAARQLRKITNELQDSVMSIRMVPLSSTFQKMNRIVRDMSKKLNKEVELEIIGEDTEVDKNIIEHISDPLMHLIRNSIDHGIETAEDRKKKGKAEAGKIILEAKNSGGDVWIIVKDDGKGLDREKILARARNNGLVTKNESELTDKEVYSFIFLPGFSTKEKVTEFSGRGVGMDVVSKNIQKIGGSVMVDSDLGQGSAVSIKIPLTLAIIDGMVIRVGNAKYTIPTTAIKESLRVNEKDVIRDPDGNEMIIIRGDCYPVLRLHEHFKVSTNVVNIHEGITIMVEDNSKSVCIFADELLGEQQVVVKSLPRYLKKVNGLAGCTLLGDGNISLILDIAGLINR